MQQTTRLLNKWHRQLFIFTTRYGEKYETGQVAVDIYRVGQIKYNLHLFGLSLQSLSYSIWFRGCISIYVYLNYIHSHRNMDANFHFCYGLMIVHKQVYLLRYMMKTKIFLKYFKAIEQKLNQYKIDKCKMQKSTIFIIYSM